MSVFHTRAVSFTVHTGGGGAENANPGNEGMTTSNETLRPDLSVLERVSMSTIGKNSRKDPGGRA